MSYTVRPISDRTRFTGKHVRSQFDSTWTSTERVLLTEINHLKGRDVVLEVDVNEGAIRKDGLLYANARPATPAVRIAFDSVHGPLTYATDRFTTWRDNVRAIALGLEALRKVDRYGITKRGEQYAGWKALPSGSGEQPSHMSRERAIAIFAEYGTYDVPAEHLNTDPDALRGIWRRARRETHPDRRGGNQAAWDLVEQAAAVLGVA